jgi:hypothetical protein
MYTVYKYWHIHATAPEAAAPTVFTFCLPAWVVQGDKKASVHLMITTHVFLASLLGSI